MSTLKMTENLYNYNKNRSISLGRNNGYILKMHKNALSEHKLYKNTRFMKLLERLVRYNRYRSVYFGARSNYIRAMYDECVAANKINAANSGSSAKNGKAALLIGINYVGTQSQLNGCENDVYNTKKILKSNYGYKDEDILILSERESDPSHQPTYDNIVDAISWLVKKGNSGYKSLWFQYSGHGYYFRDDNGDEADGYDECIVTGDNYAIMDDHFREILIKPLPEDCNLFCFMDCCHSGTMMDLKYKYKAGSDEMKMENNSDTKCNVISISGCRDDQVSMDAYFYNEYAGALTKTFWNAVISRNYQNIDLFSLIKDVRSRLAKNKFDQVPQLMSNHSLDKNSKFSI